MMTITDAFVDKNLLGPSFAGPSWDSWRVVLKAAFGLRMSDEERRLFRTLAQRDPPKKRVKELWIVAGMRAGKDSIASLIAAYFAAFTNYRPQLRPGEAASVLCLACDRQQAKIV
jgi:hypothetical protein